MRAGSFTPGALSTPEDTSTPGARVMRQRRRDVLGVEPARQHEGLCEIEARQELQSNGTPLPPGSVASLRRLGVEQDAVGDGRVVRRRGEISFAARRRSPS